MNAVLLIAAFVVVCGVSYWHARRVLRADWLPLGVADRVWSETMPEAGGVVVYVSFVDGGALVLRAAPGQRVTVDVRPPKAAPVKA